MRLLYFLTWSILLGNSVALEGATGVVPKKITDEVKREYKSTLKSDEEPLVDDMHDSIPRSVREQYRQKLIAAENEITQRIKELDQQAKPSWAHTLQVPLLTALGAGIAYAAKKAWDALSESRQQKSAFNKRQPTRQSSSRGSSGSKGDETPQSFHLGDGSSETIGIFRQGAKFVPEPHGEVLVTSMSVSENPLTEQFKELHSELSVTALERTAFEESAVSSESEVHSNTVENQHVKPEQQFRSESSCAVQQRACEKTFEQVPQQTSYTLNPAVVRVFHVEKNHKLSEDLSRESTWKLPDEQIIAKIREYLIQGNSINSILNKGWCSIPTLEGRRNILSCAISEGKSIELVKFLLNNGIRRRKHELSFLNDYDPKDQREKIALLMLAWGKSFEDGFVEKDLKKYFRLQSDLLLRAIIFEEYDELHRLLSTASPDDINKQDFFGMTLLHWAMARGNCEAVIPLLKKGANRFVRDEHGLTPVEVALRNGNSMIQYKADAEAELAYQQRYAPPVGKTKTIFIECLKHDIKDYMLSAARYQGILSVIVWVIDIDMFTALNGFFRTNWPTFPGNEIEEKIVGYLHAELVRDKHALDEFLLVYRNRRSKAYELKKLREKRVLQVEPL
jgi:Ankyrin repeats (many copies)